MAASTFLRRQAAAVVGRSDIPDQLYLVTELPRRDWMLRKNGKTLSRFTALRWAIHGKGGLKLKTVMVGGARATCDAWALAFFEALAGNGPSGASAAVGSRDHEDAERELREEGFGA